MAGRDSAGASDANILLDGLNPPRIEAIRSQMLEQKPSVAVAASERNNPFAIKIAVGRSEGLGLLGAAKADRHRCRWPIWGPSWAR